jgi:hypothetical protein
MPKIPHNRTLPTWIQENLPPELATSTLFKFNVKLQAIERIDDDTGRPIRKEIVVDILPDLDLDPEIVEQQMAAIPAQYAFGSAVYSEVRLGVAVAERKLKARKAEVIKAVVAEFIKDVGKPPPAETLKMIIEADKRLNETEMNFQHAQMQAGKLYHMLESLKMKAELARSLLGLKKQERNIT